MGETRIILDAAYLDLAERRKPGLKAALLAVRPPNFTPPPGQVALLYREWRRIVGPPSPQEPCARRVATPTAAPGAPQPALPPVLAGRLRFCRSCPAQPTCAVWASGDCRGRAYLGRPLACCPLDPPRWRPARPDIPGDPKANCRRSALAGALLEHAESRVPPHSITGRANLVDTARPCT